MSNLFDNLAVLQSAERLADEVWGYVMQWPNFARDTVGKQLTRAIDSIGANIAEAFGRYHYGEKQQFLYYARGSLYESKYWLNRAEQRALISSEILTNLLNQLTLLLRQLNGFQKYLKQLQKNTPTTKHQLRETATIYNTDEERKIAQFLFPDENGLQP